MNERELSRAVRSGVTSAVARIFIFIGLVILAVMVVKSWPAIMYAWDKFTQP